MSSSGSSSSVGLALCMVGQLGTSMLWQPRWRWLTGPCESVWSDFSDAGYSQPVRGKKRRERGGRSGSGRVGGRAKKGKEVNETKLFWLFLIFFPPPFPSFKCGSTFVTYPRTASAGADRGCEGADALGGYVLTAL